LDYSHLREQRENLELEPCLFLCRAHYGERGGFPFFGGATDLSLKVGATQENDIMHKPMSCPCHIIDPLPCLRLFFFPQKCLEEVENLKNWRTAMEIWNSDFVNT
jgi:hypothetical protein